jgi:hypothetical protein
MTLDPNDAERDPNNPERLISVPTDVEAAAIVAALASHGVEASATGGFTAGFRAEAPGEVQVIVRHADLQRAREILAQIEQVKEKIDWSQVDVGLPEEEQLR